MNRIVPAAVALLIVLSSRAPASAVPRFGMPMPVFEAKAAQSLYVYNAGVPGEISGEYARYSLPDLQLQETTVADGVGSPVAFGKAGQPYFLDEATTSGFALYGIPAGKGAKPGVEEFSGIPCYASSLATGPTGNVYVVQYCSGNVLEYTSKPVAGGGSKKPVATYAGGNLGQNGPYPTAAIVDKKGGLYIGDTGGGVTYFAKGSKTPVIAYPTGDAGYVNQLVVDDKDDVWSIHGPNPSDVNFRDETHCVIDPSGSVARNEVGEEFSAGTFVAHLYSGVVTGADEGADGLSIAVDSKLRVYAGVGAQDDSVVLDYAPGDGCPNDSLSILGVKSQDPQIAVDAKRNVYVTDTVDNTISVYAEASTKRLEQITQQSGLIDILYAAIH